MYWNLNPHHLPKCFSASRIIALQTTPKTTTTHQLLWQKIIAYFTSIQRHLEVVRTCLFDKKWCTMHNKQVDHGDNSKILAFYVSSIHVKSFFPPNSLFKEHVERETRCMSKGSYIYIQWWYCVPLLRHFHKKNNGWFYVNWMVHALMFLHVNGEITYQCSFCLISYHVVKLCWYLVSLKSRSYWFSMVDNTMKKRGRWKHGQHGFSPLQVWNVVASVQIIPPSFQWRRWNCSTNLFILTKGEAA